MEQHILGSETWQEYDYSNKTEFKNKTEYKSETESLTEQFTGFLKSWGEMVLDLGKGCKEIIEQSLVTEDSFLVKKLKKPLRKVSGRLRFLNEFLPEDRDPLHAWPVIFFVSILALAAISVNSTKSNSPPLKRIRIHPPSANRLQLPDGRYIAYHDQGVPADRARFSMIAPHSFLSSRLAGIPGIRPSLLEEFGVRLVTYDLSGFGESDPHPSRDLNSSAWDMLYLADAVGIHEKFWVLGYSSGSMHSWAALKFIPDRIAGAAFISPMINPYEPSLTKEEKGRTWEQWSQKRRLMYFLARKSPRFLSFFYRRSFLSGKHGRIDQWISQTLGKKDEILIESTKFEEFWHRDVEESVRQGSAKPFIEEAILQVSNWGFNLKDLQMHKKCQQKGILLWLKSMYSEPECELAGFLRPIHIWQGMDDQVAPPRMTDYISRVLPQAIVHRLPEEGHFSFFFFCHECHKQILSTLFGRALGPIDKVVEAEKIVAEAEIEAASPSSQQHEI